MANRPAKVTQSEISRTLKGAEDSGMVVGWFEVDHRLGKVTVYAAGSAPNGTDDISKTLGMQ